MCSVQRTIKILLNLNTLLICVGSDWQLISHECSVGFCDEIDIPRQFSNNKSVEVVSLLVTPAAAHQDRRRPAAARGGSGQRTLARDVAVISAAARTCRGRGQYSRDRGGDILPRCPLHCSENLSVVLLVVPKLKCWEKKQLIGTFVSWCEQWWCREGVNVAWSGPEQILSLNKQFRRRQQLAWSQECCPLTTRPLHCCRHSVIWFYDTALSSVLPPDVCFCLQFYVFVAQKPLISDWELILLPSSSIELKQIVLMTDNYKTEPFQRFRVILWNDWELI